MVDDLTTAAASPAFQPPAGNPRFPLADATRGCAVLAVVWAHAAGLSGAQFAAWWGPLAIKANIAVHVFFALSGFLLYRPFAARHADGRRLPALRTYARRRALRILPAYWVALTVLGLTVTLPFVMTGDWWRYYSFTWVFSSDTPVSHGGIAPAWSLATESQCYVMMPLLALAARQAARRLGVLRGELLVIGAAFAFAEFSVIALHFRVFTAVAQHTAAWSGFMIGMLLAVVSVARERGALAGSDRVERLVARRPNLFWGIAVACWLFTAFVFDHVTGVTGDVLGEIAALPFVQWYGDHVLTMIAATCVVLPVLFGWRAGGLPRRLLATRPLVGVGVISYSMYLYHYPLETELAKHTTQQGHLLLGNPTLTVLIPGLIVTVLAGMVSYRLVELPFLRRKERGRAGDSPAGPAPPATGEPAVR
jgi:peptidoglycan/LPS O-acetylase OafA/YrhL